MVLSSDSDNLDQVAKLINGVGKAISGLNEETKQSKTLMDSFGEGLTSIGKKALGSISSFLSLEKVIASVEAAMDYAGKIGKVSDALDLPITEISAWSDVINNSGNDMGAFHNTLESLSLDFNKVAKTGNSSFKPVFDELGISLVDCAGKIKSPLVALTELSKKMDGINKVEITSFGKRLGLDQGTISLLQKGSHNLEELIEKQRMLGGASKEDKEKVEAFNKVVGNITDAFRTMSLKIASTVLPALTWLLEKVEVVTAFIAKHKDLVIGFLIGISTTLTVTFLPAVIAAAIALWGLITPFAAIGAGIAAVGIAFALIYDDIMTFIAGGDSMIGEVVNRWPIIGEVLRGIGAVFSWLQEVASGFMGFFITLFTEGPSEAISYLYSVLSHAFDGLFAAFPKVKTLLLLITGMFMAVGKVIAGVFTGVRDAIMFVIDGVMSVIRGVVNTVNKIKSFFGFGDKADMAEINAALDKGTEAMKNADRKTPDIANSATEMSMVSAANNKNTTNAFSIGDVYLNTDTDDPKDHSEKFMNYIAQEAANISQSQDDGRSH